VREGRTVGGGICIEQREGWWGKSGGEAWSFELGVSTTVGGGVTLRETAVMGGGRRFCLRGGDGEGDEGGLDRG